MVKALRLSFFWFFLSFLSLYLRLLKPRVSSCLPLQGPRAKLSPFETNLREIVSVGDKFARIVSVRDIFCGGATKLSLADTNFVSRSETCVGGAGAKTKKRQKKDNLRNPFKIIKVGQDDISRRAVAPEGARRDRADG